MEDYDPEEKKNNTRERVRNDVLNDGEINDLFRVRPFNVKPETKETEKAEESAAAAEEAVIDERPVTDETTPETPAVTETVQVTEEKTEPATKVRETSKRGKKILTYALLAVLLIVAGFGTGYFAKTLFKPGEKEPDISDNGSGPLMPDDLRKLWSENEAINEDYVGQIIFDSGLINVPFVQARSVYKENGEMYVFYNEDGSLVTDPAGRSGNDVYIWTNWKTGKYDSIDEGGSIFMDYRNELDDQNIIIYGHHFSRDYDPSGTKQFTPLDLLISKDNYQPNSTLKVVLDKEIRYYTVARIFTIDMYDLDQIQIIRTDMNVDLYGQPDPEFFASYIGFMDNASYYDTGVKLDGSDRILTLVTCLQYEPQYREIVVCKLTDVEQFDQ
ncbi:MAG: class B sortase [Erysipelotrichaceae bacterium]|nr:class B sortase [Erysipelotrichaceae bacterium]